jgi:Protein of unknown function (DUF642)
MKLIISFVSFACLASLNVKAQNLILNGSFEFGSFVQNSIYPGRMSLSTGSTAINNWVLGNAPAGFLWWMQAPDYNAEDGNFSLDLDSNGNSPFSFAQQTFSTIIGQQYQFTGYFASEFNAGPASTSILIDGSSIGTETTGSGIANGPGPGFNNLIWTSASFNFIASSTSTTLTLLDATTAPGGDGAYYNPIVDNVSVVAVPEPSVLGLASAGLLYFVSFKRKCR